MRRICRRCPRLALEGRAYCSRCGTEWRTAEYRRNAATIQATTPEICAICHEGPREGDPWQTDHVVPRDAGGGHDLANLQRAHRSCNSRKGASQRVLAMKRRSTRRGTLGV